MQANTSEQTRRLIEEYNRQLLDTYRKATPPPAATPTPPPSPDTPADAAWLDSEFPLPNIARDKAALSSAAPSPAAEATPTDPQFPYTDEDLRGEVPRAEEAPAPPPADESAYIGTMRVFVYTGLMAEPIEGATVTVTRPQGEQDELYATAITNSDGFTPLLPLPSVSPALTMRPDIPNPYISYDIRISAAGFRPVIYQNVPVYGNNVVTQSANLLPLIPGQDATDPLIIRSGAPENL